MRIIAEVGSNFRDNKELLSSVGIAKTCGADVVKYQLISEFDLYGSGSKKYNFNPDIFRQLVAECASYHIDLMCSAFSPEAYDIVNDYVDIHKVASSELSAADILMRINLYGKPVVLSTGGSTIAEVKLALEYLPRCKVTLMWCVGDYPAKIIDFEKFLIFKREFEPRYKIAFSDHSIDALNVPILAKECGAEMIEKHVNFFDIVGPDSGHSLNRQEFFAMCSRINRPPKQRDDGISAEFQSVRKHKRVFNSELNRWVRPRV